MIICGMKYLYIWNKTDEHSLQVTCKSKQEHLTQLLLTLRYNLLKKKKEEKQSHHKFKTLKANM